VLTTGASVSDVIEIIVYDVFSVGNFFNRTDSDSRYYKHSLGEELILDADGDTSITADTDDQIDIKIAGADDFAFKANTFEVQTGSNIDMNGTELILDADGDTSITADTDDKIDFKTANTDRMQIDASGRLLLGTTTPSTYTNRMMTVSGNADATLEIRASSTSGHSQLVFSDGTAGDNSSQRGYWIYDHADETFKAGVYDRQFLEASTFSSTDSTSHHRTSVGYLVTNANTANRGYGLIVGGHRYYHTAMAVEDHDTAYAYSSNLIVFLRGGSDCGEIVSTGQTSCSYSTSSDYRLKKDIEDLDVGIDVLKKLRPRKFKFIGDENQVDNDGNDLPNRTVYGFIAHEVDEAVVNTKGLINGTKDATREVKDAIISKDGSLIGEGISENKWKQGVEDKTYPSDSTWKASHTKNVTQSMDYGKLTPLLTKALQEAVEKIEALEARIKKLEDG
jgi:hypothetical protein